MLGHMQVYVTEDLEKYVILYSFLKLNIMSGKVNRFYKQTMLVTSTLNEAYKVKMLLNRFCIKVSIVNPEQPVEARKS